MEKTDPRDNDRVLKPGDQRQPDPFHPTNLGVTDSITAFAKSATEKEAKMTLLQGIRLYPKAIAWSMLISTYIAMEGYDVALINNFCKSNLKGGEKEEG